MDKIRRCYEDIYAFYRIVQKSANRPYSPSTIAQKREELAEFVADFEEKAEAYTDKGSKEFEKIVKNVSEVKLKVYEILDNHDKSHVKPQESQDQTKIDAKTSKMDFNFETGLKLPTLSDDKDEFTLRDFIDTIKSYHSCLNDTGKKLLLEFVCLNRIQGKAKTRLGDLSHIKTFDALKNELYSRCGIRDTLESLHQKLSNTRQGNKSLSSYVEELDLLSARIATMQIKAQSITDPAAKLAVQNTIKSEALMSFKKGIHEELKVVVEAARPNSLEEALAVATSSTVNVSSNQVTYYRGQNRRFRGRWRHNYRPHRSYNSGREDNYRQNFRFQRNNYRSTRGYQNRGRNSNPRVHVVNDEPKKEN